MNILFYLGHPAHFHLFKNTIRHLKDQGHVVRIFIRSKDVLEMLLDKEDWIYTNILSEGRRKNNRVAVTLSLLKREWRLFKNIHTQRPDIMLGTSAVITHIGWLLGIPSIVVNEDDADTVPYFARLAYPLATHILAPSVCRVGKWDRKAIRYHGYHELAYLHPHWFTPDRSKITSNNLGNHRFFIIRFSDLTAHHDIGKTGISSRVVRKIIQLLSPCGNVAISSERTLDPSLDKWRISIPPEDIHHALFFADMFIGDSQTMTAEAAVLGTPALRYNDFVGKISYLDELEDRYSLTYGIPTSQPERLYDKIREILSYQDIKKRWEERRQKMLSDKIDVTSFLIRFIENYPESAVTWKNDMGTTEWRQTN